MYRVGDLVYLTRHVAVNGGVQSGIQVFEYNAVTNTVLAQQTLGGTADPNFNSFYPSIAANANGDFVIGYTRTGLVPGDPDTSRWFSSYATVGNWNGSTLSFTSPIELHAGERDYVSFDTSPKRWGDYSATNLDPSDPGIFWTTQEYTSNITTSGTTSVTNWATRATELIPTVSGEKRWSSISATNARGISGEFNTVANWYGGESPASTDHVIFSRNGNGTAAGGYTVTMPTGTTSIDRASVRQGFVTWSMSGSTLNLTNGNVGTLSLAIAEYLGTANLTVSGGTLCTVTTTVGAGINSDASTNGIAGAFNASNGALTITGPGSTWNNSGDVFVGGSSAAAGGQGAITVSAEGRVNVSGTTVLYNAAPGRPANQLTATTAGWYTTGG